MQRGIGIYSENSEIKNSQSENSCLFDTMSRCSLKRVAWKNGVQLDFDNLFQSLTARVRCVLSEMSNLNSCYRWHHKNAFSPTINTYSVQTRNLFK